MSAPPEKQDSQQTQTPQTSSAAVDGDSASTATPGVSSSSSSADPLTCQWAQCRERCTNPEALYDHVCERHVGRKSTNNLSLQCQWGNCHTTTVKRDHITSHIRVHVPLKPHKCEFCGKSFKRPQDLKKHVKTHADESVILRSPEPSMPSQKPSMMPQSYQHASSRQPDYYPSNHSHVSAGSYAFPHQATSHGHYGQPMNNSAYNSGYGPVYYNIPQANGFASSAVAETRKRGFEDLNDFFGDVKRRHVDASQYQDLGARFSNLMSSGMPISSFQAGYHAGLRAANGSVAMVDDNMGSGTTYQTATHVPSMQSSHYNMPFTELKTKSDLLTIDHFLEQLQHTVYDNADQVSAVGVQAMPQHSLSVMPANSHRTAHSPSYSSVHSASSGNTPDGYPSTSTYGRGTLDDSTSTPALTPSSYAAYSHSPASSQTNMSPVPHSVHAHIPTSSANMYPTLPSLSSLADVQGANGNAAPLSHLGSAYDDVDTRRRYSGGFLQRAQPARSSFAAPLMRGSAASSNASGTSPTDPSANGSSAGASPCSRRSSIELSKPLRNVVLSSPEAMPIKLPGVAEMTRGSLSDHGTDVDMDDGDKKETWVRNVRVIEELLKYVRSRLEKGDYVDNEAAAAVATERGVGDTRMKESPSYESDAHTEKGSAAESLYPVLRPVAAR